MSGKIFINYRRGDDAGFTQALYQRLETEFTEKQKRSSEIAAEPGIPDFADGHFLRQAHTVLLEGHGDLAAVM